MAGSDMHNRRSIGGNRRSRKPPARPAGPKKKCAAATAEPPRKNSSACRSGGKCDKHGNHANPSRPQGSPSLLEIVTLAPPARKVTWLDKLQPADREDIEQLADAYARGELPAHINGTTLARLVLENRPSIKASMETVRIWFQTREREYRAERNGDGR